MKLVPILALAIKAVSSRVVVEEEQARKKRV
jgi:hypothetical protein